MSQATVQRVAITQPKNPELAGYEGRVYLSDGRVIRVLEKHLVEPYDIGEAFQSAYFPFDKQADCIQATKQRARQFGWGQQ